MRWEDEPMFKALLPDRDRFLEKVKGGDVDDRRMAWHVSVGLLCHNDRSWYETELAINLGENVTTLKHKHRFSKEALVSYNILQGSDFKNSSIKDTVRTYHDFSYKCRLREPRKSKVMKLYDAIFLAEIVARVLGTNGEFADDQLLDFKYQGRATLFEGPSYNTGAVNKLKNDNIVRLIPQWRIFLPGHKDASWSLSAFEYPYTHWLNQPMYPSLHKEFDSDEWGEAVLAKSLDDAVIAVQKTGGKLARIGYSPIIESPNSI